MTDDNSTALEGLKYPAPFPRTGTYQSIKSCMVEIQTDKSLREEFREGFNDQFKLWNNIDSGKPTFAKNYAEPYVLGFIEKSMTSDSSNSETDTFLKERYPKEHKPNFTNFRVSNFKAFSNPVDFPIRPITLLFGPNSSGKSSFLKSLLFLKQTLSDDVGNLTPMGDIINLGQYEEYVYNRDTEKEISFDISINIQDFSYLFPSTVSEPMIKKILSIGNKYKIVRISIESSYDGLHTKDGPIKFYLGDEANNLFFKMNTNHSDSQKYAHTNVSHSFWKRYYEAFDKKDNNKCLIKRMKDMQNFSSKTEEIETIQKNYNGYEQAQKLYELYFSIEEIDTIINSKGNTADEESCLYRIKYKGIDFGPLIMCSLINYLFKKFFEDSYYIGALRPSPARQYLLGRHKNTSYSTVYCEDLIHRLPTVIDQVNNELYKLDIPYKIKKSDFCNQTTLAKSNILYALDLWNVNSECYNNFSDVGFGISQILPIIIQCCLSSIKEIESETIIIEQPELHLHPAMQAKLGDLFINTALRHKKTSNEDEEVKFRDNSLIIETHSEHLILRILRRVRETAEGRNDSKLPPIYPEDVSVLYVQPGKEGAKVIHIPVNKEGEFERPWPQGFFAERAKELF